MSEKTRKELLQEIDDLRWRLREAEDNLNAIRQGEIDAIVVSGARGEQVFTLKEADRPYRIIIEEMSEGTVTVSNDGIILYCNRQMANMLGVSLERLIGTSLYDHVSPSSVADMRRLISKDLNSTTRAEIVFRNSGDRDVYAFASFSPLELDGAPVFLGVVTDVTRQKKVQESLKKSNELLERMFANTHVLS
ncbi:MAG: PAS domain S-box protein, partial [Desulfomonilia bacterium]